MDRRLGTLCALSLVMAAGVSLSVAATPEEAPEKATQGEGSADVTSASDSDLEREAAKTAASGDVELARKQLKTLVKSQPTRVDYRHRLAAMNAVAGKPELSEVQAAAAVALQPDFGDARRLAVVSRGWRDVRPLRRQPQVTDIRAALGEGRIRTAARWADTAIESAPTSEARGQLQRERARALLALGRPGEAQRALKLAGAEGHSNAQMWFEMGESALQLGARDAARFYFDMAAEVGGAKNSMAEQARRRAASLQSSGNQ